MRTFIIFSAVLALAHSFTIPDTDDADAKFEAIKKQAEIYFQNAPKSLQEDAELLVVSSILLQKKFGIVKIFNICY